MITRVAITAGDPNGIGPEIIVSCLRGVDPGKTAIILVGHPEIFRFYAGEKGLPDNWKTIDNPADVVAGVNDALGHSAKSFGADGNNTAGIGAGNIHTGGIDADDNLVAGNIAGGIYILPPATNLVDPWPGNISAESGGYAMHCLDAAIGLCMQGHADAMVTAPISKEAIHLAGYDVPGHTEYLARKSGTADVLMTMVSPVMRLGLATGHLPLKDVAAALTVDAIMRKLRILDRSLRVDFGLKQPRIAVLGLNPHAGDGGVLGNEEQQIIIPAIAGAKETGIAAEGPYPADAFFARKRYEETDAVLAMYHDQGLIPFKSTDEGRGVNVTAGLPFVRTSPDHGTAFDIAGKNLADPSSLAASIELAITIAKNRFSPESQP